VSANFTGLTSESCAAACNENGCVLGNGRPHCMHPCKGSLPLHLANDPELMQLRSEACAVLGVKNTQLTEVQP
jgi:hypothetical protein